MKAAVLWGLSMLKHRGPAPGAVLAGWGEVRPPGLSRPGGARSWETGCGYLSPGISHMSRTLSYTPPCESHICLAVFWFGVPGLHVLPEYVPPEAVHIRSAFSLIVGEQAASGSASRATVAMLSSIFLEPIVVASCLVMVCTLPWSETPMAPPRSAPARPMPARLSSGVS